MRCITWMILVGLLLGLGAIVAVGIVDIYFELLAL